MKRILKWIGIVLAAIVALIVVALLVAWGISANRLGRSYEVEASFSIDVPVDDSERIDEGERLYTILCTSCHEHDLAGEEFSNDLAFGRIYTANLTSGEGGIGATHSDEDIAQVVWYGVKPDGSPTFGMPYELHDALNPEDLGSLIAYIRSVDPVDTDYPGRRIGPMARVMHVVDLFPLVTAEKVEMDDPPPEVVSPDDTLTFGAYRAVICTACHMQDFGGNSFFGSPNITAHESALGTWTEADFTKAIRMGITPDGSVLDPEEMPWLELSHLTDEELHAIWEYLQSIEPVES